MTGREILQQFRATLDHQDARIPLALIRWSLLAFVFLFALKVGIGTLVLVLRMAGVM